MRERRKSEMEECVSCVKTQVTLITASFAIKCMLVQRVLSSFRQRISYLKVRERTR